MAEHISAGNPKLPAIAGVAFLHVALGYALVSGLAGTIVEKIPSILTVTAIDDVPPPPAPQPRAQPKADQPRAHRIDAPTPPIDLPRETVIELPPMPMPTPVQMGGGVASIPADPVAPTPQFASQATTARAKSDRAAWITSEDYPSSALRNGDAGVVAIRAVVDTDGRVIACNVTQSSGSAALDAATCRLYQKRGRYTPARDEQGNAVGSIVSDRIRWEVPR